VKFTITEKKLGSVKQKQEYENIRCANQAGRPLLTPPVLVHDVERAKELSVPFALVTSNDDTDATTFKVLGRKRSNTTQATRPEVDSVGGSLREIGCLGPSGLAR